MKKVFMLVSVIVLLFTFSAFVVFAGGGKEKEEAVGEEITISIWTWGEDEAPGLMAWLEESGKIYHEMHPNITLEAENLEIDSIYPRFLASIAADDPPDLHMLWGGVLGLEQVWAGNCSPISDYWTEEDLSKIYSGTRGEGYWNGKQWSIPLYISQCFSAINKDVWRKSGLDPDNPPTDWDEFVAALEKMKAAGYIPWAMGIKDGYYGAWFTVWVGFQYLDSFTELYEAVVGEKKLTDPEFSSHWYDIQEIRDKGLFNDDKTSLTVAEGNDKFLEGNVGFVLGVGPMVSYYMQEMGQDNIGVMIAPSRGQGKLKGHLPVPAGAELFMPKNAKHKKEVCDFMRYLYSEERANALYKSAGVFSGSNQINPDIIDVPQHKLLYKWMMEVPTQAYNFSYPGAFEEALYSIGQIFIAGEVDAAEAARLYEEAAEKWRQNNPEQIKNFKIWIEDPFQP